MSAAREKGGSMESNRRVGAARTSLLLFLILFALPLPADEWWKAPTGPVYQVLVYSFADSDGDGRGDIKGLCDELDYLNDDYFTFRNGLNVQALLLSPVHPASSYHGYDVLDYEAISPALGSMADFDRLILECRRRGVKVIMDMVFNHSSREHPWFKAFLGDPEGPYGDFYVRKDGELAYGTKGRGSFYEATGKEGKVEYFSSFGEGMPDLNCANPAVVAELKEILAFWMARGVDGFRFDAVKHVFDANEVAADADPVAMNLAFWKDLRAFAKSKKPDIFFLGEVLSEYPSEIAAYSGCMDSLFDFPEAKRVLAAVPSSADSSFVQDYAGALASYQKSPGFLPTGLLSNHDQDRSMGVFLSRSGVMGAKGWGPDPDDGESTAKAKGLALARAKIAAALLFTLPGLPLVYYGEELGMTGRRYLGDDIARRDCFPWSDDRREAPNATWTVGSGKIEAGQNSDTPPEAEQARDGHSLLRHYRRLSEFMLSRKALQGGAWEKPDWPGLATPGIIAYGRRAAGERLLILHNLGPDAKDIALPEGTSLRLLFQTSLLGDPPSGKQPARGSLRIPALDSMIFSY